MTDVEMLVYDGIRKTINRFRENPFFYFTESDIHASLHRDIMEGGSKELVHREDGIAVSLVHLEYPTNFRYEKRKLLEGYGNDDISITSIDNKAKYGDRGNFDLVVLNKDFVLSVFEKTHDSENSEFTDLEMILKRVINKDASLSIERKHKDDSTYKREVQYAIEVKFIHPFNARNINMLEEVITDNEKLRLATEHSDGFTKAINLVFCSSQEKVRSDREDAVIRRIREYIRNGKTVHENREYKVPEAVLNVFIDSHLDESIKNTDKPITWPAKGTMNSGDWRNELISTIIR